jgi:hypothetical protein
MRALPAFSRFYQDFPGIRRFPHRFATVAEFYALMGLNRLRCGRARAPVAEALRGALKNAAIVFASANTRFNTPIHACSSCGAGLGVLPPRSLTVSPPFLVPAQYERIAHLPVGIVPM